MAKKRTGACAYCGIQGPITRDHVIPKSLFTRPLSPDMITVPACEKCNGELSAHQDYLRDFLVMDYRCARHPVATALREGEARRAILTNRSDFVSTLKASQHRVRMFSPAGLYLGNWLAVPLEDSRVDLLMQMMVKGLYFYHFKESVPANHTVSTFLTDAADVDKVWLEELEAKPLQGPIDKGNGAIRYSYQGTSDDPPQSIWIMTFYGGYWVVGITHRTEENEAIVDD